MTIKRTFVAGNNKRQDTDMGEFSFDVERVFAGTMEYVGSILAVKGSIVMPGEIFGDVEVGYFSMIDTTQEEESLFMAKG